jgi:hypothetical protein
MGKVAWRFTRTDRCNRIFFQFYGQDLPQSLSSEPGEPQASQVERMFSQKNILDGAGLSTDEGMETIKSTGKVHGAKLDEVRRVIATHGHMGMSGWPKEFPESAGPRYSSVK